MNILDNNIVISIKAKMNYMSIRNNIVLIDRMVAICKDYLILYTGTK